MSTQVTPTAKTAAATLTAAELATGIITFDGTAGAFTVPTGALLDVAFPSMKVNSSFEFNIINLDSTDAATVTASTGSTLVGVAAVAANTACTWRVRKTADATYVFYRVAG
jgi:heme A synthase